MYKQNEQICVCYLTKKSCAWEPCTAARPDFKTPFKNHATAWTWTATEIPILTHLGFSRYVDDGRPFWQYIVSSSTGCSDLQYFEELYQYYTTEKVRYSAQSNWVLAFSFFWYVLVLLCLLSLRDVVRLLGLASLRPRRWTCFRGAEEGWRQNSHRVQLRHSSSAAFTGAEMRRLVRRSCCVC
jgi:hypothetical protein